MVRNVIALGHHKPQNDMLLVLPSPPGELQAQPASGLLEGPLPQKPVPLGLWETRAPEGSWCEWLHSEALLHHLTAGGETAQQHIDIILLLVKLFFHLFFYFPMTSFDDNILFLVVTYFFVTGSFVGTCRRDQPFFSLVICYLPAVY